MGGGICKDSSSKERSRGAEPLLIILTEAADVAPTRLIRHGGANWVGQAHRVSHKVTCVEMMDS